MSIPQICNTRSAEKIKQELLLLQAVCVIEDFKQEKVYVENYLGSYRVDDDTSPLGFVFVEDETDESIEIKPKDLLLIKSVLSNKDHWLNHVCNANVKEIFIFIVFKDTIFRDKKVTPEQFISLLQTVS